MSQTRVPQVIDAFARGEIVVVTDDDDRENEGDLILATVHTTPEKMAFIIRNTCGIVCAPLTGEIARRLHLAPMVADSDAIHGTAFTISVDYRHGTTTGISADDRTATIRNLANGNAGRSDFVRPGPHLERARIERLLAAGASIKGTARKFEIDHHALRRHWINHVSLVAFTHNQNPFGLWSCWDRAANSFGARPPRQVCGRQPKSRREYPAVALEGPAELGNGPSPSPQRTSSCAAEGPRQQ